MGINTNNYNLIKPAPEDFYNIQDYNGNMDIIDGQLKKLDTEKEAVIQKKTAFNKNYETSSANIKMNGTANVGSSDTIARGDHVHPTDTSRAASTHNHDGVYATAAQGTKADAAATQTSFNTHLADYVRQPGYGITTGSANTYILTLSPAPTVYIDGMGVSVKINAVNTGASTLNVNGLGAKAIVDSKGNALSSGKLRSNGIYALRYDGTNFVLLGEAIEGSGSGLDADLLDGKDSTAFATAAQGTKADAALPASSYTASDVLTKLKTVDGSGSGIDADLLDGKEATAFATAEQGTKADNALPASSYTASDVLTKLKTVDGSGCGIDADLLDGKDSTAFATAAQGAKADAAATQTSFNTHLADYIRQPGYGTTAGSANTYTVTLSPAPTAYIDGMGIIVKINAVNTGASTLNVNGLGAKAIVDSKGNALTAGKLRLNGIYSLRFDGTNFVLLGEAIEGSGSKLDADLLDGKDSTAFATATQGTKADNALPAASYTASDVLTKLKTVDGSGSGIDADLLDGKEATAFATAEQGTKADNALPASSYTASDVLTKLKTVDGSGCGLDADLLDGKDSTAFASAAQGAKADAAATQTSFNTHLADYIRQPGYGTTAGSANTYTVTLSPAPTVYIDGMGVVVKINAANTTASTLNVNALGAKAIVDSKGNALIAGKLRLNGVYSLRYDGTNFVLLGEVIEGSGSGLDADLLDGKDSTAFATAAQGTKADNALPAASYTASDVLAKLKTVDGSGSGIDADLLDGKDSTAFATAAQGIKADNAATQASFNTHLSDYVRQPGYGITTGSANTYTVTLSPAPTFAASGYIDGMGVVVKINAVNTGASTLNVNGVGASAIVDSKGNALTAGKLRLNGVYSLRFDGTNFVLLGEAIEGSGSKLDADLLDGKEATAFATAAQGTKADNALPAASYTASDVLTKLKTVDGSGSGIDADLLDGKEAIAFATAAQGAKADAAATQTSFNTHLSDTTKHKQAYNATQLGDYSNAEGYATIAMGYSHAEGYTTTAYGFCSHAEGYFAEAKGDISHAEGATTTASGYISHAEGYSTTASGDYSHAEGYSTTASNSYSHAEGYYTTANGICSHTMGFYNKTLTGNLTSFSTTSDAFVIGNGTSENTRSNAFRVTFDGKTYGLSAFNSTGADYAEFFEWADGNIDNEDRVGYFVTLDGDKIRKAISTDEYILGVVSVNPSVIGDNYADDWSGKYVTDEWGRIQYHNVVVPATYRTVHHAAVYDKNTETIVTEAYDEKVIEREERTDYVPILNPDWDSSQEYISREHRKEWSAVGMMGKLLVRDDGTCQVNGFSKPNDAGIATTATNGYRVMKRVSDEIVQILVK